MKNSDILKIINVATSYEGYETAPKAAFHRLATQYLKELARLLGLKEGTYEVRSNKGGIAVLGEVILHSDNLYIHLGGSLPGKTFYWRTVEGRKDYSGGRNMNTSYHELLDPSAFAQKLEPYNQPKFLIVN